MRSFLVLSMLFLLLVTSCARAKKQVNAAPGETAAVAKKQQNFYAQLEIGETYWLKVVQTGCFSISRDSIEIIRNASAYLLNYRDTSLHLNAGQLEALGEFEKELLLSEDTQGCTSIDSYFYADKKGRIALLEDGSCDWNGFNRFLESIGLQQRYVWVPSLGEEE